MRSSHGIFKCGPRAGPYSSGGGEADRTNLKYYGSPVGVPTCIQQSGGYCGPHILLNYERMLLDFRSEDRSSGIQPTPCQPLDTDVGVSELLP